MLPRHNVATLAAAKVCLLLISMQYPPSASQSLLPVWIGRSGEVKGRVMAVHVNEPLGQFVGRVEWSLRKIMVDQYSLILAAHLVTVVISRIRPSSQQD